MSVSNDGPVSVSPENFRLLAGLAEQQGIKLPGADRIAPEINVSLPIRELALRVGELVRSRDIFVRNSEVVTIDPERGKWEVMTPGKFCGWIEEFAIVKCGGMNASRRVRDSLSREEAALILEQSVFREKLRVLNGVHEMRLPVRRRAEDGSLKWEFLPLGYDEGTGIFTTGNLSYEMDWSWEKSRAFLDEHGEEYPFLWPEVDGKASAGEISTNRSWSVVVAAMLGMYLRAGFEPGKRRPMIVGLGNQAGTGKSTLIHMILSPVMGMSADNKFPKDEDRLDLELDSAVLSGAAYLFFDDMKSSLASTKLNAFITSGMRSGRVLGSKDTFSMPHSCQIFVTGKDVKLTQDLQRRALIYEMFLAKDVQGRKFRRVIDTAYLCSRETRAQFLAALCGLVRHGLGMLEASGGKMPDVGCLATFEDYTATVGGFCVMAGYTNPIVPPDLSAGGAEDEDEMRTLLVKAASEAEWNHEFDRKELVELARRDSLLEYLVGTEGEKLDSQMMIRWGRKLQSWRGRQLTDAHGREFQFGYQRKTKGAKYPLIFLSGAKMSEMKTVTQGTGSGAAATV